MPLRSLDQESPGARPSTERRARSGPPAESREAVVLASLAQQLRSCVVLGTRRVHFLRIDATRVKHIGESLVAATELVRAGGDPAADEFVAAECAVPAETEHYKNTRYPHRSPRCGRRFISPGANQCIPRAAESRAQGREFRVGTSVARGPAHSITHHPPELPWHLKAFAPHLRVSAAPLPHRARNRCCARLRSASSVRRRRSDRTSSTPPSFPFTHGTHPRACVRT